MSTKDRVLIIDDNWDSILPLIEHLKFKFEVLYAPTPGKALSIASSTERPDVILLDIMMPDMHGHQLFTTFKKDPFTQDIPIIFLTAMADNYHEIKGLEMGAHDYITKPFNPSVVEARVNGVLNLRKELERRMVLKSQMERMNRQLEVQARASLIEVNESRETLQVYEDTFEKLMHNDRSMPRRHTVLIVDDSPENIHILSEALEEDYLVLYATSGSKALDIALSDERLDVILLDIVMPELDGYEVCSRLKKNAKTWHIPVIFITGLNKEDDETKGLRLGAVDYISKPFKIPVVKARITAALRLKNEMDNRIRLARQLEDLNKSLEERVKIKNSALKHAHNSLTTSEKRYRILYESAIEGIFEVTPAGRLLSASPSLARMLGYASSSELVAAINDIAQQLYLNPEDRIFLQSELEKHGELIDFETRFKTKQGDIIWVLICAKIARDEKSNQVYHHGFLIDITRRKESELKNLQHLRELRLLNKIISASVKETQPESILKTACKEMSDAFNPLVTIAVLFEEDVSLAKVVAQHIGHNPDTTGTQPLTMPFRSVSFEECPLLARVDLMTSPQVVDIVDEDQGIFSLFKRLDGQNPKSVLIVPLNMTGEITGCLVMAVAEKNYFTNEVCDLAQSVAKQISGGLLRIQLDRNRRQLEEQYFQAQKMEAIGTLTGGVAHDFNNLLTVILGTTGLMKLQADADDNLLAELDLIHTSADRAASLVRQLLAFSRQQIQQPQRLNLNTVLKQFQRMLKRVIGEHIEMKTKFACDIREVRVDQGQLEQVIMNLVVNARDAMPHGGKLTIETANEIVGEQEDEQHPEVRPGRYAVVEVRDTGTGIDSAVQPHLFVPFFTTKSHSRGTGLGLSTVEGIIKQSSGHVLVDSEVGKGTTFKIYLPSLEDENIEQQAGEQDKAGIGGLRGTEAILVVEDDEPLRNYVHKALSSFGYLVRTAEDAGAASALIAENDDAIDLLLTDVVMPGGEDGVKMAKRFCANYPGLKALYMSGYGKNIILQHGVVDFEKAFIAKPFQPEELARKVRDLLGNKSGG